MFWKYLELEAAFYGVHAITESIENGLISYRVILAKHINFTV